MLYPHRVHLEEPADDTVSGDNIVCRDDNVRRDRLTHDRSSTGEGVESVDDYQVRGDNFVHCNYCPVDLMAMLVAPKRVRYQTVEVFHGAAHSSHYMAFRNCGVYNNVHIVNYQFGQSDPNLSPMHVSLDDSRDTSGQFDHFGAAFLAYTVDSQAKKRF